MLSDDYFAVPETEIAQLRSDLTILGGRVVHGSGDFAELAPELPRPMPSWSPVAAFGGYQGRRPEWNRVACGCENHCGVHQHDHAAALAADVPTGDARSFWGVMGCSCWAV